MTLQDALRQMDERSFAQYKGELRDIERRQRTLRDIPAERLGFAADDPGYPLGRGMPLGRTLRADGESHRQAWMRVVRGDPCAYCGRGPAGTVDHVEPRSRTARGIGGAHTWLNFAAACESCNAGKKDGPLLAYLLARRGGAVRRRA